MTWQTLSEFDRSYTGWCWIVFHGTVVEAFHRGGQFRLSCSSTGCYNGQITHVMKWVKPAPPGDE